MGAEDLRLEVVGRREAGEFDIAPVPAGAGPGTAESGVVRRLRPIDGIDLDLRGKDRRTREVSSTRSRILLPRSGRQRAEGKEGNLRVRRREDADEKQDAPDRQSSHINLYEAPRRALEGSEGSLRGVRGSLTIPLHDPVMEE